MYPCQQYTGDLVNTGQHYGVHLLAMLNSCLCCGTAPSALLRIRSGLHGCLIIARDFTSHSSLLLYRTLQPEYQYARYLSEVKCSSNRRLMSRFRSGCHGLRVDTGRWEDSVHLNRKDRLCLVCRSSQQVEDEHHFLFDCPAYSSIRASHASLFQCACSVSDFFDSCEANACGGFIRNCFSLRSNILAR